MATCTCRHLHVAVLMIRTCSRCNVAGPEHLLDSAIAAAELLDKCPGCAAVLQRGGRPQALVDAALAEQAAHGAQGDGDTDRDADDGRADGARMFASLTCYCFASTFKGVGAVAASK